MEKTQVFDLLYEKPENAPAVSIYLKSFPTGNTQRSRLKLKSLARKARDLIATDSTRHVAPAILEPLEKKIADLAFENPRGGVGIFLTKGRAQYVVGPWTEDDRVVVSETFHTKPLVNWAQKPSRFFLLSVTRKNVVLSSGDGAGLHPVMDIALESFTEPGGGRKKISRSERRSIELRHYLSEIEEVLEDIQPALNNQNVPLVIAGKPEFITAVKRGLYYLNFVDGYIDVNPRFTKGIEMHKRCIEMLETHFENQKKALIQEMKSTQLVHSIHEVAKASVEGRVQQLIVAEDHMVWGHLNRKNGKIKINTHQMNSKDDDLLDDISEEVLKHRGQVLVLPQKEIPGKQLLCASMRW